MLVFATQGGEGPSAQRIALEVANPVLRFSFVLRGIRPAGQQGATVVTTEAQQLGIEFGVTPIGVLDRRAQVVEINDLADTAEGPKSIFQAADQIFRGLLKDGFTVSLARKAQDHAQHPRPTMVPLRVDHGRASAEINLHFLAGLHLDTPHPLGCLIAQLTHETFDRLIRTTKVHFRHQVLINPLGAQPLLQLRLNACLMNGTMTGAASLGCQRRSHQLRTQGRAWRRTRFAGGRNRGGCWLRRSRAGGRNGGGFCRRLEIAPHRLAVNFELAGNASPGPTLRRQLLYCVLFVHLKDIRHSAEGYARQWALRPALSAP